MISTAKELLVKFSKPNEDDSQGAIVSPSISSASKKYKNTLGIALNMPVLYHWLTKALPLESGTTPTMITAETMQMAITFTDTLATIKGILELVSLIFSVFNHVTHALTTVTVCHLCVRLSLTTKQ